MTYRSFLVFVLLFLMVNQIFSIILRVRLANGILQRLELDDAATIEDLGLKLTHHNMATINSSYTLGKNTFSIMAADSTIQVTELRSLDLSNGEVLTVLHNPALRASNEQKSRERRQLGTSKTRENIKAVTASSRAKGNLVSLSDIQNRRSKMIKITREKFNKDTSIGISQSTMKILERLSSNGGVGLLLGKVIETSKDKKHSRKGTSYKSKNLAISTGDNKGEAPKNRIEVLAVCELFHCKDANVEDMPWTISIGCKVDCAITDVLNLSEMLGLSVVGCCIGFPLASKKNVWSTYHTVMAMQLIDRCKPTCDSSFIVLSADKHKTSEEDSHNNKRKFKSRKPISKPIISPEFSVEAFRLSNQSKELFSQGYINASLVESEYKHQMSDAAKLEGALNVHDIEQKRFEKLSKLFLSKNVMLKHDETQSVDALLLAVPLPISSSISGKDKDSMQQVQFVHAFPTPSELLNDPKKLRMTRKGLSQIFGAMKDPNTKAKLRDPHLLMYLNSNGILDPLTMKALGSALMSTSSSHIPSSVAVVLDMIKQTLLE